MTATVTATATETAAIAMAMTTAKVMGEVSVRQLCSIVAAMDNV